jgi:hypothetical protein
MVMAIALTGVACRRERPDGPSPLPEPPGSHSPSSERPGSHSPCGGMVYRPQECPAGEDCVDVPDDCRPGGSADQDCPRYCVTAQPQ